MELGVNVALGYFAQEHEQVDPSRTTLDNIDDSILKSITERRALLGSFGLSGKLVDQMPATLSGGERAKLGLAMLAAGRPTCSSSTSPPTTSIPPPPWPWGTC